MIVHVFVSVKIDQIAGSRAARPGHALIACWLKSHQRVRAALYVSSDPSARIDSNFSSYGPQSRRCAMYRHTVRRIIPAIFLVLVCSGCGAPDAPEVTPPTPELEQTAPLPLSP